MRRLVPYPAMTVALLALWLLLNQSVSPGQILIGIGVALVGGWTLALLDLPEMRLRRPLLALRLAGIVLTDILRSNLAVARIILGLEHKPQTSGFVHIPLDLRDPYGLAVLACIITSTPGTLWVNLDSARNELMIHVLDLIDEDDWVGTIKGRYERLLLEIFT